MGQIHALIALHVIATSSVSKTALGLVLVAEVWRATVVMNRTVSDTVFMNMRVVDEVVMNRVVSDAVVMNREVLEDVVMNRKVTDTYDELERL